MVAAIGRCRTASARLGHRLLIVASEIDPSSERIIEYLSDTHGVDINAVKFQYFSDTTAGELLVRVFLVDPEDVETRKNPGKRLPNLSYQGLEASADQHDVGELYRTTVAAFGRHLQRHTTRSPIGFTASLNGGRRTILSLLPKESSSGSGLRFQIYLHRLQTFLGLSQETCRALLPANAKPWAYPQDADADWRGVEGFFSSAAEIDNPAKALGAGEQV